MSFSTRWWIATLWCGLLFVARPVQAQSTTLDAPGSVPSGSNVKVTWTGPMEDGDTVLIVPVGAPDNDNAPGHDAYTFGHSPVGVTTPEAPGDYEIRFISGSASAVRARRKLVITPVTASVSGPATTVGGKTIEITVSGPHNEFDRIGILPAGAAEGAAPGRHNDYTFGKSKVYLATPEEPGQYEIRYLRGQSGTTLARAQLTVTAASASVHGPGTAAAGATISVQVTGPKSESDTITVVPAGAPDDAGGAGHNSFIYQDSNVRVKVPERVGPYEIRYLTGGTGKPLAREPLSVVATSATVQGPGKAAAGSSLEINWKGPGNEFDHLVIAPKGAPEDSWVASDYVFNRHPLGMTAPLVVGQYELRYQTGQSGTTLARDDLEVTPAQQEPGRLRVTASKSTLSAGGAVEIILDASGSMLQRLGSERRIDIAKQTLTRLTSSVIPVGTPFALRVFGGEAKSCQSRLDIPLSPLDAAGVSARIAALQVQSNAKTPIGASLDSVAKDLSSVKGERVVILVTDGEETCGGNPARAIQKLRKGGTAVRVNIVGFAVEDAQLAATFRHWSAAGNGVYFNARDAAGLNDALAAAIRPAYEVLDAKKKIVADGLTGGEPVTLLPGTYSVSLKGQKGRVQRVTVQSRETASADF